MILWEQISPGVVVANLNPRGMVGRIYVVNHYANATNYNRSCRLHGFRSFFIMLFPIIRQDMEANDLQGMANLDPRGMVGMVYVGDHHTLLYTKYTSCEPHGYRKD